MKMSSRIQVSIWNKRTRELKHYQNRHIHDCPLLHLSPGPGLSPGSVWVSEVFGVEEGPGPYPDMSGAVVRLITGASSPLLGRPRHPARLCVRLSCGVPLAHSGVSNTGLLLATCLALLLGGSLRLSLK